MNLGPGDGGLDEVKVVMIEVFVAGDTRICSGVS